MNINEYIEKNSVLKRDDGKLTLTMCVAPIKIVDFAWQESDATKHFKINTKQVLAYLSLKGYNNITPVERASIDNKHPRGLTATWVFETPVQESSNRKSKRTKRKSAETSEE